MIHKSLLFAPLVAVLVLSGCKRDAPTDTSPEAEEGAQEQAQAQEDGAAAAPEGGMNPELLEPTKFTEEAPATYTVRFETTKGPFEVKVQRELAPIGADRFYNLVKNGFYDRAGFFRVVPGFVIQFGLPADPQVGRAWRTATIEDDPVKGSNTKGTITFATAGPNSRTTQVFINFADNSRLDRMGFAPFGEVVTGMDVVESLNAEYRERPNQGAIQAQGNAYLEAEFPNLDYIKTARIVQE